MVFIACNYWDGIIQMVPIYDGYSLNHCINRLDKVWRNIK